jgi:16S rRNA U516 pseudouridylate synthase RsuA-like enzyme
MNNTLEFIEERLEDIQQRIQELQEATSIVQNTINEGKHEILKMVEDFKNEINRLRIL